MATKDPLLEPFRLKHLTLRNRFMSTAHEPSYTEDGMPKARYRLCLQSRISRCLAIAECVAPMRSIR